MLSSGSFGFFRGFCSSYCCVEVRPIIVESFEGELFFTGAAIIFVLQIPIPGTVIGDDHELC